MRIVFMGTPEVAVPSLRALIEAGYEIAGVFTQPDKPKGRGYQLTPPPVKELAMAHSLPVFQPQTLKTDEAKAQVSSLHPDLIAVVAYGKILPKEVLNCPPLGCVNVHGSLLPKYRGAGPIQWSVLNGEAVTGVTTMYMAEGLDTGDMILKRETPIGPDETADELHDRLAEIGAQALIETVRLIGEGTAPRTPQDDGEASYAPMLSRELSPIDFTKPASSVHNQIRGLSSWPCACTTVEGKTLKVYRSRLAEAPAGTPGELLDDKRLLVSCGDGRAVELLEVQLQGSKRMGGPDFLRGKKLQKGTVFSS